MNAAEGLSYFKAETDRLKAEVERLKARDAELYRLALDLIAARDQFKANLALHTTFLNQCFALADRAETIRDRIEGDAVDAR